MKAGSQKGMVYEDEGEEGGGMFLVHMHPTEPSPLQVF